MKSSFLIKKRSNLAWLVAPNLANLPWLVHAFGTRLGGVSRRQRAVYGSFMGGKWELAEALKHLASGKLKAVIDSAFPLKEARAAHEKMESRNFFGKILLRP